MMAVHAIKDATNFIERRDRSASPAGTREAERLREWQRVVAEAAGYINYAEGQGGYEVADAQTVARAIRAALASPAPAVGEAGVLVTREQLEGITSEGYIDYGISGCPECKQESGKDHQADCWIGNALDALAAPAPQPDDPVCADCGHAELTHGHLASTWCTVHRCGCEQFRLVEPPNEAPQPAAPAPVEPPPSPAMPEIQAGDVVVSTKLATWVERHGKVIWRRPAAPARGEG
jgi:hypothetical protein